MSPREQYLIQIKRGRSNLLAMLVFTAINTVLYITKASMYFPFSAFFPQVAMAVGYEFYAYNGNVMILIVGIIATLISMGIYLLCYGMSKLDMRWLIGAMVIFSIDTIAMVYFLLPISDTSIVVDFAFHGWVLFYLIKATIAISKFKKLPIEDTRSFSESTEEKEETIMESEEI